MMVNVTPQYTTTPEPRLRRLGEAAEYVYGKSTPAAKARLSRMADRGELRVVLIGQRRDRWFATAELDRLIAGQPTPIA